MSLRAMLWAFDQDVLPSSNKFVLVALANFSGETGKAFPTIGTISRLTNLHEETIRSALANLVANNMIRDTGKTTGATGQVKVYELPEAARESLRISGGFNPRETPEQDPAKPRTSPRKYGDVTKNGNGNGNERHRGRFTPPTIEECRKEAIERGLPEIEGDKFFNHFTASNWARKGGVRIQKWKAAMATWKINYAKWSANDAGTGGWGKICP